MNRTDSIKIAEIKYIEANVFGNLICGLPSSNSLNTSNPYRFDFSNGLSIIVDSFNRIEFKEEIFCISGIDVINMQMKNIFDKLGKLKVLEKRLKIDRKNTLVEENDKVIMFIFGEKLSDIAKEISIENGIGYYELPGPTIYFPKPYKRLEEQYNHWRINSIMTDFVKITSPSGFYPEEDAKKKHNDVNTHTIKTSRISRILLENKNIPMNRNFISQDTESGISYMMVDWTVKKMELEGLVSFNGRQIVVNDSQTLLTDYVKNYSLAPRIMRTLELKIENINNVMKNLIEKLPFKFAITLDAAVDLYNKNQPKEKFAVYVNHRNFSKFLSAVNNMIKNEENTNIQIFSTIDDFVFYKARTFSDYLVVSPIQLVCDMYKSERFDKIFIKDFCKKNIELELNI